MVQVEKDIIILGIESSCDDTSAAVIKNGELRHLDGFVNSLGSAGAGGILESKRIKRHAAVENGFQAVDVESGAVSIGLSPTQKRGIKLVEGLAS